MRLVQLRKYYQTHQEEIEPEPKPRAGLPQPILSSESRTEVAGALEQDPGTTWKVTTNTKVVQFIHYYIQRSNTTNPVDFDEYMINYRHNTKWFTYFNNTQYETWLKKAFTLDRIKK